MHAYVFIYTNNYTQDTHTYIK